MSGFRRRALRLVLARLEQRSKNLSPLQRAAGLILVGGAQRAFRNQAWDGHPWAARYSDRQPAANIAGIVADLATGGSVKDRRLRNRPVAVDTGSLRRSIAWRPRGIDEVEVGSALDYADRVQRGGTSTQEITPAVRQGLAKFLRSAKGRSLRSRLGWLLARRKIGEGRYESVFTALRTSVIPRQYVGTTPDLLAQVRAATTRHLRGGR